MVYNSIELKQTQTQPPNVSSEQQWRPKMRKISFPGTDFLEGSLWPTKPPEAVLVLVVHAAALGHSETRDPCGHVQSVPPPEALVTSLGFVVTGATLMRAVCVTT